MKTNYLYISFKKSVLLCTIKAVSDFKNLKVCPFSLGKFEFKLVTATTQLHEEELLRFSEMLLSKDNIFLASWCLTLLDSLI